MRQFVQKIYVRLFLVALLSGMSGVVSAESSATYTDYPHTMHVLQQFYQSVSHIQHLKQPKKWTFKPQASQCIQKLLFHPDVVNLALSEQQPESLRALEQKLGDPANQTDLDKVYQVFKQSQSAKTAASADKLSEQAIVGIALITGEDSLYLLVAMMDSMKNAMDRPELQMTFEKTVVLEPECLAVAGEYGAQGKGQ